VGREHRAVPRKGGERFPSFAREMGEALGIERVRAAEPRLGARRVAANVRGERGRPGRALRPMAVQFEARIVARNLGEPTPGAGQIVFFRAERSSRNDRTYVRKIMS
jgi:hypothetical protein